METGASSSYILGALRQGKDANDEEATKPPIRRGGRKARRNVS